MNVLITGISGFAGSFLAEYITREKKNAHVYGTIYSETESENIESIKDQIELFRGDLRDREFVKKLIAQSNPDYVFHLAAIAYVGESFKQPEKVILNNIQIQLNLLEEIRLQEKKPRILIIGSADEYGLIQAEDNPIAETHPLNPVSPYALSKMTQDLMGQVYHKSYGMPIVRVRPFNHIGPRQAPLFVVSSFAQQVALAETSSEVPVVKVGNLSTKRDFTDVRDMMRAYWLALEKGVEGEVYNLGSGTAYEIGKILNSLISMASVPIRIETDQARLRPIDQPVTICDCRKFSRLTGWKPAILMEETLTDILNYWRKKVKNKL